MEQLEIYFYSQTNGKQINLLKNYDIKILKIKVKIIVKLPTNSLIQCLESGSRSVGSAKLLLPGPGSAKIWQTNKNILLSNPKGEPLKKKELSKISRIVHQVLA